MPTDAGTSHVRFTPESGRWPKQFMSTRLGRGDLAGRFGSGGAFASFTGMVEYSRAPSGDGKAKLVERKGERHPHRLVELLAFALMHDRNHEIVRFDLELFERLDSLRRMRLAHEIQYALQKPQPPRARVSAQITR